MRIIFAIIFMVATSMAAKATDPLKIIDNTMDEAQARKVVSLAKQEGTVRYAFPDDNEVFIVKQYNYRMDDLLVENTVTLHYLEGKAKGI